MDEESDEFVVAPKFQPAAQIRVPNFVSHLLSQEHTVGNSILYKQLRHLNKQKHVVAEKSESAASSLARPLQGGHGAPDDTPLHRAEAGKAVARAVMREVTARACEEAFAEASEEAHAAASAEASVGPMVAAVLMPSSVTATRAVAKH